MMFKTLCFRVYSEEQPGDAATALFIKNLSEEDQGNYRCTAIYASNQELEENVEIQVFSKHFSFYMIPVKSNKLYSSWNNLGRCTNISVCQYWRGLQGPMCCESQPSSKY